MIIFLLKIFIQIKKINFWNVQVICFVFKCSVPLPWDKLSDDDPWTSNSIIGLISSKNHVLQTKLSHVQSPIISLNVNILVSSSGCNLRRPLQSLTLVLSACSHGYGCGGGFTRWTRSWRALLQDLPSVPCGLYSGARSCRRQLLHRRRQRLRPSSYQQQPLSA